MHLLISVLEHPFVLNFLQQIDFVVPFRHFKTLDFARYD